MNTTKQPLGITILATFFILAAIMSIGVAITLLFPGTALDSIWKINEAAYRQFQPFQQVMGIVFLLLPILLLSIGYGFMKRRVWAWYLALAIFALNLTGDIFKFALMGSIAESLVGILIAGGLLYYLTRPAVKSYFLQK